MSRGQVKLARKQLQIWSRGVFVASGEWRCFVGGGLGGVEPRKFFEGWHFWMQETNDFTNLTRLSSFLLLDMLFLIDMTWNTHVSAKNTERERNKLGDREIDKRRVDRQKTQILNDAWPNRVQTYAEGSAWSVVVACLSWTSPSQTLEEQHGCTIAFALQQWHVAFSGESSFFTNWAGLFFFCFVCFLFFFLFFSFLLFFGTRLLTLRNLQYVATRLMSLSFLLSKAPKRCSEMLPWIQHYQQLRPEKKCLRQCDVRNWFVKCWGNPRRNVGFKKQWCWWICVPALMWW